MDGADGSLPKREDSIASFESAALSELFADTGAVSVPVPVPVPVPAPVPVKAEHFEENLIVSGSGMGKWDESGSGMQYC